MPEGGTAVVRTFYDQFKVRGCVMMHVGTSPMRCRSSPSAGGCRCAEGGTPDPCHRDHPARPGVKVEPPQPPDAAWPSQVAGAGGEEVRP